MSVRLILGDCIEAMRHLTQRIDALISDPPYGISLETNYADKGMSRLAQAGNYAPIVGDDRPFDPQPFLNYPVVVLFGANHYADKLPPSAGWVVWDKRDGLTPNDQADCELIWSNQDRAARIYRHRWMGMIKDSEKDQRRVHPTQKPLSLMIWLIERFTKRGDTVFDPYMGSGTTGVACVQTGRSFVGCEIVPDYYHLAEERIALARTQSSLFALDDEDEPSPAVVPIVYKQSALF